MSPSSLLLSYVKPTRNEAAARLRTNGLALVVALVVTNLLPLPSPYTAFRVSWATANDSARINIGTLWHGLCIAELLTLAILSFNVAQAVLGLKYPATLPPLPPSPARQKPLALVSTPNLASSQRRLSGISTISPQAQKSFGSSNSFSTLYASSPLSTPSRTIHYSTPLDMSIASSTGSPSPILNSPLAAYRGRHRTGAGRAFDGEFLSRLQQSALASDD